MAQFDVCRLSDGNLVVDCQADLLDHLTTRFVVPLVDPGTVPGPLRQLHPVFEIGDQQLLLATHLSASVPAGELGQRVLSLQGHYLTIGRALDFLLAGI